MQRKWFGPLLALAVILGLLITWVDSRPGWDDTAILVGAILVVTGLLGLAMPQRAWLWALAVGGWIPLVGIIIHHSFSTLAVLLIAFIGAYAGSLAHALLIAAWHKTGPDIPRS